MLNGISGIVLAGLVFGGLLGLVLRYFIFRASCALVDADPSHLKSILIVLIALVIATTIGGLTAFVGTFVVDPLESTFLYIVWNLIGLAVIWAILGTLYIPTVRVSAAKGFLLSGYEIALGLLANALIVAIYLVVFAAVQIATDTGPKQTHSALPAAPSASAAPAL